jgi:hypothetical protein
MCKESWDNPAEQGKCADILLSDGGGLASVGRYHEAITIFNRAIVTGKEHILPLSKTGFLKSG